MKAPKLEIDTQEQRCALKYRSVPLFQRTAIRADRLLREHGVSFERFSLEMVISRAPVLTEAKMSVSTVVTAWYLQHGLGLCNIGCHGFLESDKGTKEDSDRTASLLASIHSCRGRNWIKLSTAA